MALCIIDFIGANALLGPVGGGGPGHSGALKWHRAKRGHKNHRSINSYFVVLFRDHKDAICMLQHLISEEPRAIFTVLLTNQPSPKIFWHTFCRQVFDNFKILRDRCMVLSSPRIGMGPDLSRTGSLSRLS